MFFIIGELHHGQPVSDLDHLIQFVAFGGYFKNTCHIFQLIYFLLFVLSEENGTINFFSKGRILFTISSTSLSFNLIGG